MSNGFDILFSAIKDKAFRFALNFKLTISHKKITAPANYISTKNSYL